MKSPDESRQAILAAAEGLFARYGFKKTSIDDIARSARIGKGSVYLHFSSKEEVFAEVVRRVIGRHFDRLSAAVGQARSPAGKLRAFIETRLDSVAAVAAEYGLVGDTLMELLPLAAAQRQAHAARERALLVEVLREGTAAGAFAVPNPEALATGIAALLDALDETAIRHQADTEIRAGLGEIVSVLLRGLGPQPAHAS